MKTIIDLYPQHKDRSYGDKIFLSIYYLRVMIERQLEQRLEPFGITATQYRALTVILEAGEEGIPVYTLRQFVTEPSQGDVSRMIIRLERNGWVKRQPSKEDKRKVYAFATSKGKRLINELNIERKALELDMPALTEEKAKVLYEYLQIMVDAFADMPKH